MLAGKCNRLAAKIVTVEIIIVCIDYNTRAPTGRISPRRHHNGVTVIITVVQCILNFSKLTRHLKALRLTECHRDLFVRINRHRIRVRPQSVVVGARPRIHDVIQLGQRRKINDRAFGIELTATVIRINAPVTAYDTRTKLPQRNHFEANRNVRIGKNCNHIVRVGIVGNREIRVHVRIRRIIVIRPPPESDPIPVFRMRRQLHNMIPIVLAVRIVRINIDVAVYIVRIYYGRARGVNNSDIQLELFTERRKVSTHIDNAGIENAIRSRRQLLHLLAHTC